MQLAYVGCYTTPDRDGRGQGITVCQVDPVTGRWSDPRLVVATGNPSFLIAGPDQRCLYSVHGGDTFSEVSAFAIDHHTGDLELLNSQSSGGRNPVHLAVDPSGQMMVVANYTEGTVASLPIASDGSLGAPTEVIHLHGAADGDAVSHPHHCPFDPAGRHVVVPDKGLDRVFAWGVDPQTAKLSPRRPATSDTRAGAGPRHIAFHPQASWAYVVNELDTTITVYDYDPGRGRLQAGQVISTLPSAEIGGSTGAEIAVAPSGRFLYASNRGHDSIAVFAIEMATGHLSPVEWTSTGGKSPRFFTLDRSGRLLYAANQDSDTIVSFHVNTNDGTLTPTGEIVATGSPVCIAFVGD